MPTSPVQFECLRRTYRAFFLTDHFAYKLKKQVKFDFLDFSTPELRRRACLNEVRLNQRLAADVYIDILPITQDSNGTLNLDGRGQAIDWVVKMRRLPDDKALSEMLREKHYSHKMENLSLHFWQIFMQKHTHHS